MLGVVAVGECVARAKATPLVVTVEQLVEGPRVVESAVWEG